MDLVLGQPTRSAHHRIELFLYYTHLLVDQNHQNLQNIHIAILPNNDIPNNIHSDINVLKSVLGFNSGYQL